MASLIQQPQATTATLHHTNKEKKSSSSSNNNNNIAKDLRQASVQELLETAAGVVEATCQSSTIFQKSIEDRYPKFQPREVVTGSVLGRGGFCVVQSVEKLKCNGVSTRRMSTSSGDGTPSGSRHPLPVGVEHRSDRATAVGSFSCLPWLCGGVNAVSGDDSTIGGINASSRHSRTSKCFDVDDDFDNDEIRFTRDYVASMSRKRTNGSGKSRYVMKTVMTNVDKITFMKGCVDIAMECKFLASLDHANIINLIAVSQAEACHKDFFLILERMEETLHTRIKKWMDQDRHNKSLKTIGVGWLFGGKHRELALYKEQIAASYDISEALYYLHCKNIIFRDLKPDNIGFDSDNVLKLFDFGLAKELLEKDRIQRDGGLYRNMTKCTGAIRYMAPEVGLGQPYGLTADTYSWSMLVWFMLALEPPYGMYTNKMIIDRVMRRNARPILFTRWRDMIRDILKASWDPNPTQRPSFLEISLCLKQELIDCDSDATSNKGHGGSTTMSSYHGEDEGLNSNHGGRQESEKTVPHLESSKSFHQS